MAYNILKAPVQVEQEFKKSRFIAYLTPVESREETMEFLNLLKLEHPDAVHHCWAFVVGDPTGSGLMGMSDDNEPHGTAGRPMLDILKYAGVGDVAAVVVRYWGGTKLGTGGLVRAYSSTVKLAVDSAELIEKEEMTELEFQVSYAAEPPVRRLFEEFELSTPEPDYGADGPAFSVTMPLRLREDFTARLMDITNGQAVIK